MSRCWAVTQTFEVMRGRRCSWWMTGASLIASGRVPNTVRIRMVLRLETRGTTRTGASTAEVPDCCPFAGRACIDLFPRAALRNSGQASTARTRSSYEDTRTASPDQALRTRVFVRIAHSNSRAKLKIRECGASKRDGWERPRIRGIGIAPRRNCCSESVQRG